MGVLLQTLNIKIVPRHIATQIPNSRVPVLCNDTRSHLNVKWDQAYSKNTHPSSIWHTMVWIIFSKYSWNRTHFFCCCSLNAACLLLAHIVIKKLARWTSVFVVHGFQFFQICTTKNTVRTFLMEHDHTILFKIVVMVHNDEKKTCRWNHSPLPEHFGISVQHPLFRPLQQCNCNSLVCKNGIWGAKEP